MLNILWTYPPWLFQIHICHISFGYQGLSVTVAGNFLLLSLNNLVSMQIELFRRVGLHISIHTATFHHRLSSSSGDESAWVNGFSILLFKKRSIFPFLPVMLKHSQSYRVRALLAPIGVAPNPKGSHVCVLFVQRHLAASGNSQSPCATLERQVCCVIRFLKLHLLN